MKKNTIDIKILMNTGKRVKSGDRQIRREEIQLTGGRRNVLFRQTPARLECVYG